MTILIGFAGYQGSGKDACSKIVMENEGFVKYAFADPVKSFCKELFNLSDEQLWGDSKNLVDERYKQSPRQLMQKFGTDFVRNMISDRFWIDKFADWYSDQTCSVVVSDVRFGDEVEMIKKLGGKVFLVKRPSLNRNDLHVSEDSDSLRVDDIISNDGTLEDFSEKVGRILQEFL